MNKWIIYALAKKESGGGSPSGGDDTVPNPALRLIDWEGTVLKEYSRESALALTELPEPSSLSAYAGVDHELLLFQEWNWSLADIKEWIQEHNGGYLLVGAFYTPTDEQNHDEWDYPRLSGNTKSISAHKRSDPTFPDNLFANYNLVERISLPNGVEQIGGSAFSYCSNLKHLNIPKSVKVLNVSAFSDSAIESISIPHGVTDINASAFRRSGFIRNIIIPDSVVNIGIDAFHDCISLETIVLSNNVSTIPDSCFWSCRKLKSIKLPETITVLDVSSFRECYSLKNILLPENLTTIKSAVFFKCTNLIDIIIEGTPALENTLAFNSINSNALYYVPRANLSWFETATNWSTLYSGFVAIEDNIEYLESLGYNVDAYKTGGAA